MNITSSYQLTILVPVYNEADNMERLEATLSAYLPHATVPSCILFVNDGSTDNSLLLIRNICRRQAHFYYISYAQNRGLSTALKAGIDTVESNYVGYIDADLQTDPEDFNKLLAYVSEYPLVMGIRAQRNDSWGKRLQSRFANTFRRFMTGDTATDTGCPLKIMWTSHARRLPAFNGMHRFLPALMMLQDAPFKEIPVRHYPRMAGQSKYHLWNRLFGPLADCFGYRWLRKRYISYQFSDHNLNP